MKITSSIEYASRLMTALAQAPGTAAVSSEKLAESENVPADYVTQLLLKLRRAGLVVSSRGSAGGYALARPAAEITMAQIVRAVDGQVFEDVCEKYDAGEKDCRHQGRCALSAVWRGLKTTIEDYFTNITLADLALPHAGGCAPAWLNLLQGENHAH